MNDTASISIPDAEALIAQAFAAEGVPAAASASVARALVAAEAEGQVGHGFSRLADYVAQVRSGKLRAAAEVVVRQVYPASVLVDAGFGFAYPALDRAVVEVVSLANTHGTGVAAITRSHHCGALSVQVEKIAQQGVIGIMMANTPAAMAPWGAKQPVYGTNPIAFAIPREGEAPLVADLSLSRVARGKVMHARKTGQKIPEGWALDREGSPTTDPAAALAGSMVPIGEAKGAALALLVEILSAVFAGANLSSDASSFLDADGPPPGTGQFLLALKPHDASGFASRLTGLLSLIEGLDGARLPGSRRAAMLDDSRRNGLNVPASYVTAARRIAQGDG